MGLLLYSPDHVYKSKFIFITVKQCAGDKNNQNKLHIKYLMFKENKNLFEAYI